MNKKQTKTLSRIWQKLMNIFNKTPATKQDLFEHFNQLEEEKLIDRDELNMIRGVILVIGLKKCALLLQNCSFLRQCAEVWCLSFASETEKCAMPKHNCAV